MEQASATVFPNNSAPIIDLAPACMIPPKDGASRRIWNLYEVITLHNTHTVLVSQNYLFRGRTEVVPLRSFSFWEKHKSLSALAALLTGKDYWQTRLMAEAHLTPRLLEARSHEPGAIIANFMYSVPLLHFWKGVVTKLIVDTHNFDADFYGSLMANTRNPAKRELCKRAIRLSDRILTELPPDTVMIHVSEDDRNSWCKKRPDLHHHVVENGCSIRPRKNVPDYNSRKKRLIFVGSLSVQMNLTALEYFASVFWPALEGSCEMMVVGSNPSPKLYRLCQKLQWCLHPNVPDDELETLYGQSHFAILPFTSGAGSKLKLLEACGRGIPVLSTSAGAVGTKNLPPLVFVHDDPRAWRNVISETQWLNPDHVALSLEYASQFSWEKLGAKYFQILAEAPITTIPSVRIG